MTQNDSGNVKSAVRTLDLIEMFTNAREPLSFQVISKELKIPASSLSHLLTTLINRHYVVHLSSKGGYGPGAALKDLGNRLYNAKPLDEKVKPILEQLTIELGETSGFTLKDNDDVYLVISVTSDQELSWRGKPGARKPLHLRASGKAMLAQCSDQEINAYIDRATFEPVTPKAIKNGEQLWQEINDIRESGYARSIEQGTLGVVSVSMATLPYQGKVGALSVSLPLVRYNKKVDNLICQKLDSARIQLNLLLENES